jgi:hypothetical protein
MATGLQEPLHGTVQSRRVPKHCLDPELCCFVRLVGGNVLAQTCFVVVAPTPQIVTASAPAKKEAVWRPKRASTPDLAHHDSAWAELWCSCH